LLGAADQALLNVFFGRDEDSLVKVKNRNVVVVCFVSAAIITNDQTKKTVSTLIVVVAR
jgi:hypothetical protein